MTLTVSGSGVTDTEIKMNYINAGSEMKIYLPSVMQPP